jgi:hypothetical protein
VRFWGFIAFVCRNASIDKKVKKMNQTNDSISSKRHSKLSIKIIIFAFARTGSSTLLEIFKIHPDIICLKEPFNPNRGIAWGEINYLKEIRDEESVPRVLEMIFKKYNCIKHLAGQFSFNYNRKLLSYPDCKIIFLWRKNLLQRIISNYISTTANHWGTEREKVLECNYHPIDLTTLAEKLTDSKKRLQMYSRLCGSLGDKCMEVTYEGIFGLNMSPEEKLKKIKEISYFLGIGEDWVYDKSESIKTLLNPSGNKLNSERTYRLIPNIEEIEQKFGNSENGYIFEL